MSDGSLRRLARPSGPSTLLTSGNFLICQICLERMQSPFSTRCGHTFCHDCIFRHLEFRLVCATCQAPVTREDVFPNFTIEAAIRAQVEENQQNGEIDEVTSLPQLRRRIDALVARKRRIEKEQKSFETRSLLDFLLIARSQKQETLNKISSELAMLDRDISRVKQRIEREQQLDNQAQSPQSLNNNTEAPTPNEGEPEVPVIQEEILRTAKRPHLQNPIDGVLNSVDIPEQEPAAIRDAKAILQEHYTDLQSCYFDESLEDPLESFSQKLSKLTKLTRMRQVSALKLGDITGSSNIISSIEFDRDGQLFATAGVSKKIRFYEFRDVTNSRMDLHCPVREIQCKSKISCISWNPYVKQHIASADYEGLVTIFDSVTGIPICHLEEHEKRSWSVDFSTTDPTRLASGSDDCYVKLWSMKSRKSICTIDGKANICSVRFHPDCGHLLAFGSADHNVHLYDLRYVSKPIDVLKGHKKAVSYVRFADNSSIVSASTDCTLRLWSLPGQESTLMLPSASSQLSKTYSGHLNEKNFVGLGVQGDLFACGSENNSVYVYHRDLTKPLATLSFSSTCPLTDSSLETDVQQFVSSLCWKRDSNLLVAANSQGNIRILELV